MWSDLVHSLETHTPIQSGRPEIQDVNWNVLHQVMLELPRPRQLVGFNLEVKFLREHTHTVTHSEAWGGNATDTRGGWL